MIYRLLSLGGLAWLWLWSAGQIGTASDCRPVDIRGVLVFVVLLCVAWWLGFKCAKAKR